MWSCPWSFKKISFILASTGVVFYSFLEAYQILAPAGRIFLSETYHRGIPYCPRSICGRKTEFARAFIPPLNNQSYALLQNSTCSPEATRTGKGQNVVSYTWFDGPRKRDYVQDIKENLALVRKYYPGWFVRVYSDKPLGKELCDLLCENQEDLFYCPISFIDRFDMGNVSAEYQRQWRYLVLGDPTVNRFLSRDLDSRIGPREVAAVKDWEDSKLPFHAMRDHPYHATYMMAGMWGGDNRLIPKAREIQKDIVKNREKGCCDKDQAALRWYVYHKFRPRGSIRIHDSYYCDKYRDSVPFPTQRMNLTDYVGKIWELNPYINSTNVADCPLACRPSNKRHWIYC